MQLIEQWRPARRAGVFFFLLLQASKIGSDMVEACEFFQVFSGRYY